MDETDRRELWWWRNRFAPRVVPGPSREWIKVGRELFSVRLEITEVPMGDSK